MSSPTSRTVQELKRTGWTAQIVEKWIPQAKRRVDLFGVGDVLAIREGQAPLMVQTTTGDHVAARILKAKAEPRLVLWLRCGCSFEVWGWRKGGPMGSRKLWTLTVRHLVLGEGGEIISD